MVLLSLVNLNVKRLKKYCYCFEGTCKRMQGVNVQKVVILLLTIFNSSEGDYIEWAALIGAMKGYEASGEFETRAVYWFDN